MGNDHKDRVRSILRNDPMFNPPPEAVEAYPDECANCGASAEPFWIPGDYHEQSNPDPGICTECGKHFGGGS